MTQERQYGKQKGVSTTHCLIDIYHHIISGAEKEGNISTLVLTDFSKAFDLIDHKIVVTKLLGISAPPVLFQWVVDFLTNRKLKLNYTKCQAMRVYFGNKEIPDDDLFIANQQLAVVGKVKLLGVIIRDDLKWDGVKLKTCVRKPTRNSSCCVN